MKSSNSPISRKFRFQFAQDNTILRDSFEMPLYVGIKDAMIIYMWERGTYRGELYEKLAHQCRNNWKLL